MREFSQIEFPPFLDDFTDEDKIGVETTFQELSDKHIRLHELQPSDTLPAVFLQTYGNRRVFAIVDFTLHRVCGWSIFVESTENEDAENIQQALALITTKAVYYEEMDSLYEKEVLQGFRWFRLLG